ncbi:hypothetical protein PV761_03335 [Arthrobacter sp. CC3]|uniref:hypothetical protein n=1 Tax=Arthrobacter sp. CC3 TaxID=3029185 RepID=UPI0032678E18
MSPAAKLLAEAAQLEQETVLVQGVTAQQQLRGLMFDPMEPLPDLHITAPPASWEPAARHYRDLSPEERARA